MTNLFCVLSVCYVLLVASEGANSAILIRPGRVFDGTGRAPVANLEVLVRNGRIEAVGPAGKLRVPEGARVIAAPEATLLPGLIDAHAHLLAPLVLREAAAGGVTTQIGMLDSPRTAFAWKQQQESGELLDSSRLISAGYSLTVPNGHGARFGNVPTASKVEDVPAFVQARLAEGSDFIKIIYDDGKPLGLAFPTISREMLEAAIKATHDRGKLAVTHTWALENAKHVVRAGGDGLAHVFVDRPVDSELRRLLASRPFFVIPTLTILEALSAGPGPSDLERDSVLGPLIDPRALQTYRNRPADFKVKPDDLGRAIRSVGALHRAGVTILAGTDAGNPGAYHGASLHRELELLVQAGLKPAQALAAATSKTARAFRLERLGEIRPGYHADLLLVEGDPTRDIRATRRIRGVIRGGIVLDSTGLAAELDKARSALARIALSAVVPARQDRMVDDFEDGDLRPDWGRPWTESSDAARGGKSEVKIEVVDEGADGSHRCLRVTGANKPGFPFPWAGVSYMPSSTPGIPANLSSRAGVRFWVKGDGQAYRLIAFGAGTGQLPLTATFNAPAQWTRVEVPFSEFKGSARVFDASDLHLLVWSSGRDPNQNFSFQIDRVEFYSKP